MEQEFTECEKKVEEKGKKKPSGMENKLQGIQSKIFSNRKR